MLQPELVAIVLDPNVAPSAEQHYGLEQLLLQEQCCREEHYKAFHKPWMKH